uniref:Alternative protein GRWD1 n=1 Tax=Homo sapiens TaxID=9606 RepID=L8EB83_HUMAN|nr:alternative protein GRWD1 [Homo sapiens]
MMGTSMSSAGAAGSPSCSVAGMMGPSRSGTFGSSSLVPQWPPSSSTWPP